MAHKYNDIDHRRLLYLTQERIPARFLRTLAAFPQEITAFPRRKLTHLSPGDCRSSCATRRANLIIQPIMPAITTAADDMTNEFKVHDRHD